MKSYHTFLLALLLCPLLSFGQPDPVFVPLEATFTKPLDLFTLPDGPNDLYVVEKDGMIYRYQLRNGRKQLVLDLSERIDPTGDGGLLSATFHPDPDSSYIYVNYTAPSKNPKWQTRAVVSRFSVQRTGGADPGSEVILLTAYQPDFNHNFGKLAFGPDGFLYISTGDGGGTDDPYGYSQDRNSLLGKMLRIDVDRPDRGRPYGIPRTNPFYRLSDAREEIYALGLRNPWRFSFDRATGDLWIGDRGEDFTEEVNFIAAGTKPGRNFGWNCRVANKSLGSQRRAGCGAKRFTQPRLQFPDERYPQLLGGAVTGGYVYRGPERALRGYYVYGDLYNRGMVLLNPRHSHSDSILVITDSPILNLSTFGEGSDGTLYAVDYNGTIYRIEQRRATTSLRSAHSARAKVYPNPSTGQFAVQLGGSPEGPVRTRLMDAAGREVVRWGQRWPRGGRIDLSVQALPSGIYTVLVQGEEYTATARLLLR